MFICLDPFPDSVFLIPYSGFRVPGSAFPIPNFPFARLSSDQIITWILLKEIDFRKKLFAHFILQDINTSSVMLLT